MKKFLGNLNESIEIPKWLFYLWMIYYACRLFDEYFW